MADQNKKLSPDEMAALRDVTAAEEPDAAAAEDAACVQVHAYNFRQPGRLSAAQLRALKVVHEFFAKRFAEERQGTQGLPLELGLLSVETVSYSNFMGSIGNPCFMAQLSTRFDQSVLMEIDTHIVRAIVSRILGEEIGDGEEEPETRELTSIEQAIAGHWLEGLLPLLSASWNLSSQVDFGLDSIQCDPRFVQVLPDDSPVVSLAFRLQAGALKGQMTLCYPLEPLQELLEGMSLRMSGSGEEDDGSEPGGERILAALKCVPFELSAQLGRCTVSANQLATLRRGDVLCLDRSIHDSVDILLDDKAIFEAELGRKGDNLALKLRRRTVK